MPETTPPVGRSAGRSSWIASAFALLVLLALFAGAVAAIVATVHAFHHLNSQVAAAVVVASATVIVSVGSLIATRVMEQRYTRRLELRTKKLPVYERFITGWFEILLNAGEGGPDETKAREFFQRTTIDFTVWASDSVLQTWSRRRRAMSRGDTVDMFEFEQMLLAVRADLGHANKNLERGDLLGLWVNDIDDYLPGGSKAGQPDAPA